MSANQSLLWMFKTIRSIITLNFRCRIVTVSALCRWMYHFCDVYTPHYCLLMFDADCDCIQKCPNCESSMQTSSSILLIFTMDEIMKTVCVGSSLWVRVTTLGMEIDFINRRLHEESELRKPEMYGLTANFTRVLSFISRSHLLCVRHPMLPRHVHSHQLCHLETISNQRFGEKASTLAMSLFVSTHWSFSRAYTSQHPRWSPGCLHSNRDWEKESPRILSSCRGGDDKGARAWHLPTHTHGQAQVSQGDQEAAASWGCSFVT